MKVVRTHVTEGSKKITPVALLKFGELEHLSDLLKNGTVYLSSIEDLRKEEKGESQEKDMRNDAVEGAHKYRSGGPGTAATTLPNGKPLSFSFIDIMYYEAPEVILGNICSFYGITTDSFSDNQLLPVDEKMTYFGSHFIFIKDFHEFINRVDKALEKLKINWFYGYVEYFDEKQYDGEMHLFKKRSRFSFQNEFRIYLRTENISSMKLDIGSIQDIAGIAPSNTISELKMTISTKSEDSSELI